MTIEYCKECDNYNNPNKCNHSNVGLIIWCIDKKEKIQHSWNPYDEKRFSFADVMTKFMQFYSPFMNMSKINVTRELEPVLNQLQTEMREFRKKLDNLFFKIPKEYREGD